MRRTVPPWLLATLATALVVISPTVAEAQQTHLLVITGLGGDQSTINTEVEVLRSRVTPRYSIRCTGVHGVRAGWGERTQVPGRSGETGIRRGLKIPRASPPVRVRIPPPAPGDGLV